MNGHDLTSALASRQGPVPARYSVDCAQTCHLVGVFNPSEGGHILGSQSIEVGDREANGAPPAEKLRLMKDDLGLPELLIRKHSGPAA